jgi:hypothetical protein
LPASTSGARAMRRYAIMVGWPLGLSRVISPGAGNPRRRHYPAWQAHGGHSWEPCPLGPGAEPLAFLDCKPRQRAIDLPRDPV